YWIRDREDRPYARPHLGRYRERLLAPVDHRALRDLVPGPPRQHVRERRLAGAVGAHDRVHLAGVDREIHTLEDLVAAHGDVQVLDFEHSFSGLTRRYLPDSHPAASALRRRTPSAAP